MLKFVDVGAPWEVLVPGIHHVSEKDFLTLFVWNPHRKKLYKGLLLALSLLRQAGCRKVYIDGSFVTKKPYPSDFDGCWDHSGVDFSKLDPVLLEFSDMRRAQKIKFRGEMFPSAIIADRKTNAIFLDFFQLEKFTGNQKGIIEIDLLSSDEFRR